MFFFPIDMGFDLVCVKCGATTRDFKIWLLGDLFWKPSDMSQN